MSLRSEVLAFIVTGDTVGTSYAVLHRQYGPEVGEVLQSLADLNLIWRHAREGAKGRAFLFFTPNTHRWGSYQLQQRRVA